MKYRIKSKILVTITAAFAMFSTETRAVHTLGDVEVNKDPKGTPCVIIESDDSNSTGFYVGGNVVLTVSHCVQDDNKANYKNLRVTVPQLDYKMCRVKNICLYGNHRDVKTVAALILEDALEGIEPAKLRAIGCESDEKPIKEVTVCGFGDGCSFSDKGGDFENFIKVFKSSNFTFLQSLRVDSNIGNNSFRSVTIPLGDEMPTKQTDPSLLSYNKYLITGFNTRDIKLNSKKIKIGEGDSGGPLFDQGGNVIGFNEAGAKKGFTLLRENNDTIIENFKVSNSNSKALERLERIEKGYSYIHSSVLSPLSSLNERYLGLPLGPLSSAADYCGNLFQGYKRKEALQISIMARNIYDSSRSELYSDFSGILEKTTFASYFQSVEPEMITWVEGLVKGGESEVEGDRNSNSNSNSNSE